MTIWTKGETHDSTSLVSEFCLQNEPPKCHPRWWDVAKSVLLVHEHEVNKIPSLRPLVSTTNKYLGSAPHPVTVTFFPTFRLAATRAAVTSPSETWWTHQCTTNVQYDDDKWTKWNSTTKRQQAKEMKVYTGFPTKNIIIWVVTGILGGGVSI